MNALQLLYPGEEMRVSLLLGVCTLQSVWEYVLLSFLYRFLVLELLVQVVYMANASGLMLKIQHNISLFLSCNVWQDG